VMILGYKDTTRHFKGGIHIQVHAPTDELHWTRQTRQSDKWRFDEGSAITSISMKAAPCPPYLQGGTSISSNLMSVRADSLTIVHVRSH
jgi:hypothetical protein